MRGADGQAMGNRQINLYFNRPVRMRGRQGRLLSVAWQAMAHPTHICLNHRSEKKQMRHHARQSRLTSISRSKYRRLPGCDRRSTGKYKGMCTRRP